MSPIERFLCRCVDAALVGYDAPRMLGVRSNGGDASCLAVLPKRKDPNETYTELLRIYGTVDIIHREVVVSSDEVWIKRRLKLDELEENVEEAWSNELLTLGAGDYVLLGVAVKNFGYVEPSIFQKSIEKETWIGNQAVPAALKNYRIPLYIGVGLYEMQWKSEQFTLESVGGQTVAISERSTRPKNLTIHVRRNAGGGFSTQRIVTLEEYCWKRNKSINAFYGIKPRLELDVHFIRYSNSSAKEVDDIIEKSKVVQQKIENAIDAESLRQRDLLDTRLGQLSTRRRVNIDNVAVSYEPKNEMEVVILVAKIERRLREYVPDFELLTYASFQGVDCIASYRKSKHAPIERGFVEFETDLGHFFDHEHPFAHVSMIVCWSDNYNNKKVADISEGIYGYRNAIYLEGDGLRRRLILPDTSIEVLVLQYFPGIILEKV